VKAGLAAALALFAANAQLGVLVADWDFDADGQARPQTNTLHAKRLLHAMIAIRSYQP